MKTCSKKIITLALGSIFFSCNYDESADVKPTNEDTLIENSTLENTQCITFKLKVEILTI